ncbi:MAG: hypothetical protein R2991_16885 [Thermoanaerobaculia bacterium]
MRKTVLVLSLLAAAASSASAVLHFDRLEEDLFAVRHKVLFMGSEEKAVKLVHEKAASICVAAGYTHYAVLELESTPLEDDESATAEATVRFFHEAGDERTACEEEADPEYVAEARRELGMPAAEAAPVPAVDGAPAAAAEPEVRAGSCTVAQIAAMVRAGFSDEQIEAACRPAP